MPIEPHSPGWVIPDVRTVPAGQELVAVGAELTAGMLLAGYRGGLFGMPDGDVLGWWSPDPRGILVPDRVHVSRSLARRLGRFEVGVDSCFDAVVGHCADPGRPHGWISPDYRAAYRELHELGWAHSVEVWDAHGELAGGLFGVEVGGLFAAESMFHLATDASKVAVVALADRLAADGRPERLVDVQWSTPHLASLGAVEVTRPDYLRRLGGALAAPPVLGGQGAVAVPGPSRIRWRIA
jgi:leucyl/phenylalanyl-tRNA--protein transferase